MSVTVTASELAGIISVETDEAARLLGVGTALVERYAPSAPDAIQNEAVVRFCGYMSASEASGYGAFRQVDVGGGVSLGTANLHGPMFRNCGAAALLSPWKVRRAGAI